MSRPRAKGNRDLPLNVYPTNQGTFRYIHPATRKEHGLGRNRVEAIQAGKILNAELVADSALANKILNKNTRTFGEHLDYMEQFWRTRNTEKKISDRTLKDYLRYLIRIRGGFASKMPNELNVGSFSDFLNKMTNSDARHYRSALIIIFKHAIPRGIVKENFAEQTLPVEKTKQRKRLSYKHYKIIRHYAEPHIQNCMDLFLHTDQRPEDLVKLGRPILENGFYYFYIVQGKTKKHGQSAYIRMRMNDPLKKVVQKCQDNMLSEYLLHYPVTHPRRHRGKSISTHAMSAGFRDARNLAMEKESLYKGLNDKQLPSFYEIRSLSIFLYDRTGVDAQKIAGHKDRAMTEGYLKGHPVKWTEVDAGLDITRIEKMAVNGEFDNYE